MSIQSLLVGQFHHPSGLPGHLAGWIMATRESNLSRNKWTVDLLDIEESDDVLELGPGPGVTLQLLLSRVPQGHVVGIDHSDTMLAACSKRNREALNAERLTLIKAELPGIPQDLRFDKILAVNSLQFDALTVASLQEIGSRLKPGGRFAVTFQPRGKNPTDEKTLAFAEKVRHLMSQAGLQNITIEQLAMKPVPVVCIIGRARG
jgi:trans-aconitate methyltransferase